MEEETFDERAMSRAGGQKECRAQGGGNCNRFGWTRHPGCTECTPLKGERPLPLDNGGVSPPPTSLKGALMKEASKLELLGSPVVLQNTTGKDWLVTWAPAVTTSVGELVSFTVAIPRKAELSIAEIQRFALKRAVEILQDAIDPAR
jgi:hypothetical protein